MVEALREALASFVGARPPEGLEGFHAQLGDGAEAAAQALDGFLAETPPEQAAPFILQAMRDHCRAQELLYPLRAALPPLGAWFVEAPLRGRLAELDPAPSPGASVGLYKAGAGEGQREAFTLYVPEWYDAERSWPLVIALHGGFGHGRDFVWTWHREARSRGFLLLAPSSRDSTWSLQDPGRDLGPLLSMVDYVCEGWRVDRARMLLTGLSDGATYALLAGLSEGAPFSHLAPVSGVLHPLHFAGGNLARAKGRSIYVAHGALDWMFPISVAHITRDALTDAGAELTFREIADLSHAYPREENDRILRWFDPELALPRAE